MACPCEQHAVSSLDSCDNCKKNTAGDENKDAASHQSAFLAPVAPLALAPAHRNSNNTRAPSNMSEKLNNAVHLLDHNTFSHLQALDTTDTAALRNTLEKALQHSREQEEKLTTLREKTKARMLDAYNLEDQYEEQITGYHERFIRQMTEALNSDGDTKEALQREAIKSIGVATQASRLAKQSRVVMDDCQSSLNSLTAKDVNTSKQMVDLLYGVVLQALARPSVTTRPEVESKQQGQPEIVSNASEDRPEDQRTDESNDIDTKQSIFEQQPETANRSIGEVLESMVKTEEEAGLDSPASAPKLIEAEEVRDEGVETRSIGEAQDSMAATEINVGFHVPEKLPQKVEVKEVSNEGVELQVKNDIKNQGVEMQIKKKGKKKHKSKKKRSDVVGGDDKV